MYLMEHLHSRGVGVILDWVPSHFPSDQHGLAFFDGTHLYEHADPRRDFIPSGTARSSTTAAPKCAISWAAMRCTGWRPTGLMALRVDAVASMLYLDYGRKAGEWIPNAFGGHENLEARDFLKSLNEAIYRDPSRHPDHRRGVHRVAAGVAAGLSGGTRFRPQMEHGLGCTTP